MGRREDGLAIRARFLIARRGGGGGGVGRGGEVEGGGLLTQQARELRQGPR